MMFTKANEMIQGLGLEPEPIFSNPGPNMLRTYKRRPPECEVIKGVKERCRLCLGGHPSVAIYGANDTCSLLATRIMMCVGFEMTKDTFLPNSICAECYKQIENCYSFRKMCEVAYQKLKLHLQAVKIKEANEHNDEADKRTSLLLKCLKNGVRDNSNTLTSELKTNMVNVDEETAETVNPAHKNKDYVDLVLVINGNSVQLFQENDIDQNKVLELCDPNEEQNVIEIKNESLHQAILNNGEVTKHTQPSKLVIDVPLQPQVLQEPPEDTDPLERATQDTISTFITTELVDSQMLQVVDGGRLLLNGEVNMVLELMAQDGSLVTFNMLEEDELDENTQPKDPPIIYDGVSKATAADFFTIKPIVSPAAPPRGKINLRQNTKSKAKAKSHTCSICQKQFARSGALERHRSVHSGARPHRCRHCSRAFAQLSVCKRHEHTHAETRPFPCPQCPKGFTQRGSLRAHARSHQPPEARPLLLHACDHCPKMFLYASGLSRHTKTHNGFKYTCPTCARAFNDNSSLRRHMAKHAPAPATADSPVLGPRRTTRS